MTIYVLPPGAPRKLPEMYGLPFCDVTTHGTDWRPLSPMLLGPVPLYGGLWSRTMENAWQYAKVYNGMENTWPYAEVYNDDDGTVGQRYWQWARAGWDNPRAVRYPRGKGAKPLFSLWAGDKLDYITARRRIYLPLYVQAVRFHQLNLFLALRQLTQTGCQDIVITDFDAYDHHKLGYSWDDVINDPNRRMGHGFVLAAMIEGAL